MRAATLTILTSFTFALLAVPASNASPCGCSCQKALPERKCNENDVTYYKRVFEVKCSCENNVKQFYEDVFYQYKNEEGECYVKRIEFIFTNVYANLDCRYDIKRQQYLPKYYQYKFCKRSGESDESYFERVLTKTCESETVYKSKFELLKKFVEKVDWSKVKIEEKTKKGFSIIKKTTIKSADSCGCQKKKHLEEEKKKKAAQAKKSEGSCGCQNKKKEESHKKKESNNSNQNACGCQGNKENQKSKQSKTTEIKQDNCNKERIKQQEDTHNKNVGKIEKENKEHECRVQKSKEQQAVHDQNVNKICEQDNVHNQNVEKLKEQNEVHDNNVKKVECQQAEHEKNEKKIAAQKEEHGKNVQEVDARKQEHCENVQKVEAQKQEHDKNVKNIEAQQAEHDKNVKCIEDKNKEHDENVEKIDAQKKTHEENVKKWIKHNYCKKSEEDIDTYYKRITCKTGITNEEFVERITIARSLFSELDVWYSEQYWYLIKEYYALAYSKKATEKDDVYYVRLFVKESYESENNWARRIHLLHMTFVTDSVWYEETFYEKITKKFYQVYYKKETSESNEVYLKRVFAKVNGECEENYWKRIKLIQKTFPDYTCWSDKDNLAKIDTCKCLSEAKTEEDLKKNVESQKSDQGSEGCSKAKFDCLQVAFKSSKSSSETSESTTEEQVTSIKSNQCSC